MKENSERYKFSGCPVPVDHQDLEQIDKYLVGGFHTLAICVHGIGRSYKHAEDLCEKGTPAAFLEGGLESINEISDAEIKSKLIKAIKSFPHREFAINAEEISKYSDLIYCIGGCIVRVDPGYK